MFEAMRVLIVESNPGLSMIWSRHLCRLGAEVSLAATATGAIAFLQSETFDVIVLDLVLDDGSALAVADFANFNMPKANVVFVTDTTFFSDGSIFTHSANARAFLKCTTPPADLAEIVHHYGGPKDAAKAEPEAQPTTEPANPEPRTRTNGLATLYPRP